MHCHKCGQEVYEQALLCPYCGEVIPVAKKNTAFLTTPKSSKLILAAAIALVFIVATCLLTLRRPSFGGTAIPFERINSDKKYTLSFDELTILAEAGHIESQYQLAEVYLGNDHFDQRKAFMWMKKAASASHAEAMHRLGRLYYDATGTELDYNAAFSWFQKAADAGITCAMVDLGDCYYHGNGTDQNYETAEKLYRQAFDNGNPKGAHFLGIYYYYNRDDLPPEYTEAIKWFETAASLNYPESFTWIGCCYYYGLGVNRDYAKAVELFSKGINLGDLAGSVWLGSCYESGNGVKKNYAKAVELYKFAAERNYADGQFLLGRCMYYGNGIEKDMPSAIALMKKAAAQNNHSALEFLESIGISY